MARLLLCALAGAQDLDLELQHLWDMVVVRQQSRNVPQGVAPPVRRVCQFGLTEETLQLSTWMLRHAEPAIEALLDVFWACKQELELHDLSQDMQLGLFA